MKLAIDRLLLIWFLKRKREAERKPDSITLAVHPTRTDIAANHRRRFRVSIDLQYLTKRGGQLLQPAIISKFTDKNGEMVIWKSTKNDHLQLHAEKKYSYTTS